MLGLPLKAIETVELSSAAASIDFKNIADKVATLPFTPVHLVVEINGRSAGSVGVDGANLNFNGDATASNYYRQYLSGDGSTDSAARANNDNGSIVIPGGNTGSNVFGGGVYLIPVYSGTNGDKNALSLSGAGEEHVRIGVQRWNNTAAITDITLKTDGGDNFESGTRATLYAVDERYSVASSELSSDGTFDLSGLPQVDGDLAVVGYLRSDRALERDAAFQSINGDTTDGNYQRQFVAGDGSSTSSSSVADRNVGRMAADTAVANAFGVILLQIQQPILTTNDPAYMVLAGLEESSGPTSRAMVVSGRRNNPEAVNRLQYTPNNGTNFKAGSRMDVYHVPKRLLKREELSSDGMFSQVDLSQWSTQFEAIRLTVYGRSDEADTEDELSLAFNSDTTGTNYDAQRLKGSGATVTASQQTSGRDMLKIPAGNETANVFGGGSVIIPLTNKTDRHKHLLGPFGNPGSTPVVELISFRWENSSAINTVDWSLFGGTNLKSGSVLLVEGILPKEGPVPAEGLRIG